MKNICVSREGFEVGAMNKQNYKEVSTIGRWGRMHGRYLKDNHPCDIPFFYCLAN